MEPDRRAFLRVQATLTVTCTPLLREGERGRPYPAETVDISAGGAKLVTRRPAAQGQRLWLEIRFQQPRFLVFVEASVVRVDDDPHHIAVRFEGLDMYVQQRVVRWVYAQDRRLFDRHAKTRIPLNLRIICRRLDEAGAAVEEFAAPTLDIAGDGARVLTTRLLPEGTRLAVEVQFGDGDQPLRTAATVERAGPPDGHGRIAYQLGFPELGIAEQRRLVQRALLVERTISP